jgi:hypothetical protein
VPPPRYGLPGKYRPVGEHWTVAVALAHIQYWDGRGLGAIEAWKRHGVPLALWRNNEAAVNDLRFGRVQLIGDHFGLRQPRSRTLGRMSVAGRTRIGKPT